MTLAAPGAQIDPVEGGCSNDYAYVKDPVNEYDLDGRLCDLASSISVVGFLRDNPTSTGAIRAGATEAGQRTATSVLNRIKKRFGGRMITSLSRIATTFTGPVGTVANVITSLCILAESRPKKYFDGKAYRYNSGSKVSPYMTNEGVPVDSRYQGRW